MNVTETVVVLPIEAPTPVVARKPTTLEAQQSAIDAGSVGSPVFRSAAAYLAAHPKVKSYQP